MASSAVYALALLLSVSTITLACSVSSVSMYSSSNDIYRTSTNGLEALVLYGGNQPMTVVVYIDYSDAILSRCGTLTISDTYESSCSYTNPTNQYIVTCNIYLGYDFQEIAFTAAGNTVAMGYLYIYSLSGTTLAITDGLPQSKFNVGSQSPNTVYSACQTIGFQATVPSNMVSTLEACLESMCGNANSLYTVNTAGVSDYEFVLGLQTYSNMFIAYDYIASIVYIDAQTFATSPGQLAPGYEFNEGIFGPYEIVTGYSNITFTAQITLDAAFPIYYYVNGIQVQNLNEVALTPGASTEIVLQPTIPGAPCRQSIPIAYTFYVNQTAVALSNINMSVPFTFNPNTFAYTIKTTSLIVKVGLHGLASLSCYIGSSTGPCTTTISATVPSTVAIVVSLDTDVPATQVEYVLTFTH